MKYLLDFLSTLQGAPSVQDPDFQKLLTDVQGKQSKQDVFYENLDKIVNELKSSPEASAFLKPVAKRDAPDYYEVIKHPMDLSTVGRQVKTHRYKSKAEFARDLDLIWENCLIYNSVETHPLRAAARYMREKADHHLEFLQDINSLVPGFGSPTPSFSIRPTPGPSGLQNVIGDEDADGESEDEQTLREPSVPVYRDDRPNLVPVLESLPALVRTPHTTSTLSAEKTWFPADTEEAKADARYWAQMTHDEAYTHSLPSCSTMREPPAKRRRRYKGEPLEDTVNETIASLNEIRRVSNLIVDFRRAEQDNLPLPPIEHFAKRKRLKVKVEYGEIGEAEATASIKHASASLLAQAGFEGANEASLDLFTRMVTENISNLGKTFRLLLDGFSGQMSAEEIMLHALHENGQLRSTDLEAHIRDDIEREGQRMAEMERKAKQAYQEVTTGPAIEDDMLLANDGEMLLDGNFADQLGEDFLGLLDTGIAAEHGLRSLTVPSSVFYKRRKGPVQIQDKSSSLEFEPPLPLIPLNPTTYTNHLPGLLHGFFAQRIEAGLLDDDPFDPTHAQISSNGHITAKVHVAPPKKKFVKKKAPKKTGVGKGNWVRPSKEEKARRANAITLPPP